MKKLLIALILLILPAYAWADTHVADSCSLAHVQTAYDAASEGDTVLVPAGSCYWTGGITISKNISIFGADSTTSSPCTNTGTTLTTSSNDGFFNITGTTTGEIRISGFRFNLGGPTSYNRYAVTVSGTHSQLHIDHNRFDGGKPQLEINGYIRGVVHSNCFLNSNISISLLGDGEGGFWGRPILAGNDMGTGTLYVEENTFKRTNTGMGGCVDTNNHIESGHDGNFVIRYNTFDGSQFCVGQEQMDNAIMTHGNGGDLNRTGVLRGHPVCEIYNNLFTHNFLQDIIFRGGSVLMHDNNITSTNTVRIKFREEESVEDGSTIVTKRSESDYPAWDQIYNTFIWNNVFNEVEDPAPVREPTNVWFQEGRDYFMHAPQATGGKQTLYVSPGKPPWETAGNRYTRSPDNDNKMTFSDSGANAYYPYTPYTYPHPLRNEGEPDTTPPVLSNLSPTGQQACSPGPTANVTISLTTNEAATCKYGTSDVAYASLPNTFSTTGGVSHSQNLTELACSDSFTYYVRCIDGSSNANTSSSLINFTTASESDVIAPTFSGAVLAEDGRTLTVTLSEAVKFGAGGNTGFTVAPTEGAATVSYSSGEYSAVLVYTTSRVIYSTETLTLSFTNPGNGVEDSAGNDLGTLTTESVTNNSTQSAPTGEGGYVDLTFWNPSTVTPGSEEGDGREVNLGVKFSVAHHGVLTDCRFYKTTNNTGTHTCTVYDSSGTSLGTVNFSGEGETGWQTQAFSTPIQIYTGRDYYISVYMPAGYYSRTSGYFPGDMTSSFLTASQGYYRYVDSAAFPNVASGSNSNYWVEPVFDLTLGIALQTGAGNITIP